MALTYRYMPMHHGDNEWLSNPSACNDEGWDEAWADLKESCPHHIHFTEDMYNNTEYGEVPQWVDITIKDEHLLEYKMARGIIKSLNSAQAVVFHLGFDVVLSSDWGGWGYKKLEICDGSAYVNIGAKHASEELEIDISEQLTHAIGE